MSKVLQHKVVAALPSPLEPDSIYYVRKGSGFDIYVTNGVGVVAAYSLNANLELDGKVDKELGYSLLPNTEITRLATIHTGATKNRADSENADKVHTHTMAQVTGLDAALSGKASNTDPRFTDAREWTATTISQAEAEEGAATTRRAFTAQRLRQGITAWFTGISGAIGRTILGRSTAEQVRGDLGLGTVATRDVGVSAGNVMEFGAFGLGAASALLNPSKTDAVNCFFRMAGSPTFGAAYSGGFRLAYEPYSSSYLRFNITTATVYVGGIRLGVDIPERMLYDTVNTTKNPDGTLKASSPVINLYTDKHDLHNESQFGATPTVVRKSKGVYEITGTLGLRSDGWYLDTPSDRNGNKYFNIEWTQNITPEAADGVVDEYRDDIVVTIETFERVWNKETGLFENGDPMDINELQDRFVQLRFNEIKVEHEDLMNENK